MSRALVRIVKRVPSVGVGGVIMGVSALGWGSLYQAGPMAADDSSLVEPSRPQLPPWGDGSEPAQIPDCSTEYPKLKVCDQLPERYQFRSQQDALAALKRELNKPSLRIQTKATATSGPCPGTGDHYNVREGGQDYPASIVCCPCCDDEDWGDPKEARYCGIVAKNPGCNTRRRSVTPGSENAQDAAEQECDELNSRR
jgi:hypothetical protein